MEGVSSESYRNAQRKIEGQRHLNYSPLVLTLWVKQKIYKRRRQITWYTTWFLFKDYWNKENYSYYYPPKKCNLGHHRSTICHHFIHKKNYCTFSIFLSPLWVDMKAQTSHLIEVIKYDVNKTTKKIRRTFFKNAQEEGGFCQFEIIFLKILFKKPILFPYIK